MAALLSQHPQLFQLLLNLIHVEKPSSQGVSTVQVLAIKQVCISHY